MQRSAVKTSKKQGRWQIRGKFSGRRATELQDAERVPHAIHLKIDFGRQIELQPVEAKVAHGILYGITCSDHPDKASAE